MKRILVGMMMLVAFNAQSQFINRDHCPNFTVKHQKSGMHYELKKYKPLRYPNKGLMVFVGMYASPIHMQSGTSGRGQVVKHKISVGWDVRGTNPTTFSRTVANGLAYTNVFGGTIGKYYLLANSRILLDVGMGGGHSAHSQDRNKIPVFGYGLVSYHVWKNIWISGSMHVPDFKSIPVFNIGIATLILDTDF